MIIKKGAIRELNPGPPVPKTGIIPLDQSPLVIYLTPIFLNNKFNYHYIIVVTENLLKLGSFSLNTLSDTFSFGSTFSVFELFRNYRSGCWEDSSEIIDSSLRFLSSNFNFSISSVYVWTSSSIFA